MCLAKFRRLALAALFVFGSVGASSAADLTLTLVDSDTQEPVEGIPVEIFLSTGVMTGESDADGLVHYQNVVGRGFWVEIGGERLDDFFYVADSPVEVQIDQQGGNR